MTASPEQFRLGFSSMGAPQLPLAELESVAVEFGMEFLELRSLGGTTRLPDYFQQTREQEQARRVPVQVVSTNLRLAEAGENEIAEFMEFAVLADQLGAPYVRVFGGGDESRPIDEALGRAVSGVERCRAKMEECGIRCAMILETHSNFSASQSCLQLNQRVREPLPILWDAHHTWKRAGERLSESWEILGPWVRHIHYKDSRELPQSGRGYSYVLPGAGDFPTRELRGLLREREFAGGLSLEWERLWHPELPPISNALAAFAEFFR